MLHIVLNDSAGEGQGGSKNLYIELRAVIQHWQSHEYSPAEHKQYLSLVLGY